MTDFKLQFVSELKSNQNEQGKETIELSEQENLVTLLQKLSGIYDQTLDTTKKPLLDLRSAITFSCEYANNAARNEYYGTIGAALFWGLLESGVCKRTSKSLSHTPTDLCLSFEVSKRPFREKVPESPIDRIELLFRTSLPCWGCRV